MRSSSAMTMRAGPGCSTPLGSGVDIEKGRSPDFLFESPIGARRGVEVACRARGGWPTLRSLRKEKVAVLARNRTLAEVHVSLWCGSPRVAEFHKVKP
jgi:hypothetical protein